MRFPPAARLSFPIKVSPPAKPAKERISSVRCADGFSRLRLSAPGRFGPEAELKDRRHEPVSSPGRNNRAADHCGEGCLRPADPAWLAMGTGGDHGRPRRIVSPVRLRADLCLLYTSDAA